MSLHQLLVFLIIALPLTGFLVTTLVGRRLGLNASWIPVGAVVGSWLVAMYVIATFHDAVPGSEGLAVTLWEWIPAGCESVCSMPSPWEASCTTSAATRHEPPPSCSSRSAITSSTAFPKLWPTATSGAGSRRSGAPTWVSR